MPGPSNLDDLRIGDFERPLIPGKSVKEKAPPPAAADEAANPKLENAEDAIEQARSAVEKDLAPLERYERALKRVGVSKDEAATIVDTILMQGYWSKEMDLTPRRKVKFRSRLYADTQRFHDYIETIQPKNTAYYNEILFKFSLAASLEKYDDKTFTFPAKLADDRAANALFRERLDFVESLGDPAIRLLYARLAKFDEIVRVVMEEGAAENF